MHRGLSLAGSTGRSGISRPRVSRYSLASNPPPSLEAVLRAILEKDCFRDSGAIRSFVRKIERTYDEKGPADDLVRFLSNEGFTSNVAEGIRVQREKIRAHLGMPEPSSASRSSRAIPIIPSVLAKAAAEGVQKPKVEPVESPDSQSGGSADGATVTTPTHLFFFTPGEYTDFEFVRDAFFDEKTRLVTVPLRDDTKPIRLFADRLVDAGVCAPLDRGEGSAQGEVAYEVLVSFKAWHIERISERADRAVAPEILKVFNALHEYASQGPFRYADTLVKQIAERFEMKEGTVRSVFFGFREQPLVSEPHKRLGAFLILDRSAREQTVVVCVKGFEGHRLVPGTQRFVTRSHTVRSTPAIPRSANPVVSPAPVVESDDTVEDEGTSTPELGRLLEARPDVREAITEEALAIADRIRSGGERTYTLAELVERRRVLLGGIATLNELIAEKEREIREEEARLEREEAELLARLEAVRARKAKLE